jgi:hypothetical protein
MSCRKKLYDALSVRNYIKEMALGNGGLARHELGSVDNPGPLTRRPPLHQAIRDRVRLHVDSLRHDPAQLFAGLLDPALVEGTSAYERVRGRDCAFTPMVALWTSLSQVLCRDHPCRAAVARLIARFVARGEAPCSPDTGPYWGMATIRDKLGHCGVQAGLDSGLRESALVPPGCAEAHSVPGRRVRS